MDDEPDTLTFLGKDIGTFTGWDGDQEHLIFYDFIPNELGMKFVPDFPSGNTIYIDINKGEVTSYLPNCSEAESVIKYKVNWSVFNKEGETNA